MSEPIFETFTDERGNMSVRASQEMQVLTQEEADRMAAEFKQLKDENFKLWECLQEFADLIRNDVDLGVDQGRMIDRLRELGVIE